VTEATVSKALVQAGIKAATSMSHITHDLPIGFSVLLVSPGDGVVLVRAQGDGGVVRMDADPAVITSYMIELTAMVSNYKNSLEENGD